MNVLIVQENEDLGRLWTAHLKRAGGDVTHVVNRDKAMELVERQHFDVVIIDLMLNEGDALSVSDFVHFHQRDANVVFVTDTTFFSDGSIFAHAANARVMLKTATPPEDLAAIVAHYGQDASRARAARGNLVTG